jgi:Zinc-ribbon containing domain
VSTVRDDVETTSAQASARCPVCGASFHRVRRQTYCSPACKQAAWRDRTRPTPTPVTPAGRRREHTVYQCGECDTRYLGEQWCPDCTRPCRSIGPGGLCGHCTEPLTVQELLAGEVLT